MLTRRHFIASTAGVALAPAAGHAAQAAGGVLVAVTNPEPPTLSSGVNNFFTVVEISTNIYEGLVDYDEHLTARPRLARAWDVNSDLTRFTFHLRPGVTWHDGQPFTSRDVRFSALEVWRKLHPRGRGNFRDLVDVETPDDETVIFHMGQSAPVFMYAVNGSESPVMAAHIYENRTIVGNPENNRPTGTGPFRFVRWARGDYVELRRNERYWQSGYPKLDRLFFRFARDAEERAAAFETGEVDYGAFNPVPLVDLARFRSNSAFSVEERGYSWESPLYFMEFNLSHPILKDRRVRQALACAIDRDALLRTAWQGYGRVAVSPVSSRIANYFTDDVRRYAHDPAEAERLLDLAGYPRQANGIRFSIDHVYAQGEFEIEMAAHCLRSDLAGVGIDLRLRTGDIATISKTVYTDYDFATRGGKFACMIDPSMGLYRLYWSKSHVRGVSNTNASGYANPEMDRIIESVRTEIDPARRVALYAAWQRLAMEDLPVIPLIELHYATVYARDVADVSTDPDGAVGSMRGVRVIAA